MLVVYVYTYYDVARGGGQRERRSKVRCKGTMVLGKQRMKHEGGLYIIAAGSFCLLVRGTDETHMLPVAVPEPRTAERAVLVR